MNNCPVARWLQDRVDWYDTENLSSKKIHWEIKLTNHKKNCQECNPK